VKRYGQVADMLMPWAGLMTGVLAIGVAHQFGSDGQFDDCLAFSPVALWIVSVLAIAATIAGAFASWRVFRNDREAPARKVVAIVSVGACALFVYAMILPLIAAVVIPPCFQ
jgi:hypothetical protein